MIITSKSSATDKGLPMKRILVAECKQEVSTFNPMPSHYDDFRIVSGAQMIDYHRTVHEEISGALSVFDQHETLEIVPTVGASSITSGGVLTVEGFEKLTNQILEAIREAASAGEIDGVYFCLHGAMQAANEDDPEGYLLQEARKILGEEIPIVISLDLHGIATDRMLEHSDAVAIYHTYPHVDFFETGARAGQMLVNILQNGVRPVTARIAIPALVRGDELVTETGSISECISLAKEIEASADGVGAGVMWGNPFTDVPELRTNSIVSVDGDEQAAIAHAQELANRFWRHHEKMQVPLTSLEDSVRQAKEVESGTVILMDAADATSSGASGDSNSILAELIRQDYQGKALIPIVAPRAVEQAFEAGVGSVIQTAVGGELDPGRYEPVAIEARVRSLSDGEFLSESFGWHWNSGDTAVLQVGKMTIIVGTRPVSLFDRSWFYANGQDPKRFDAVIVKSPHCEPQMFEDWAARVINVDAPGSTSANLHSLGHKKCARPIFPLDDSVEFKSDLRIFNRNAR
jgi:microcystin degradation protein MlrC